MATVELRYDPKDTAWFAANAAMVLKLGEPAYHETTGLFKLGDGVTALSALSFLPNVSVATPTLQQVLTAGSTATLAATFGDSLNVNNIGTGALPVNIQGQVGNTTWPALYMGVTPSSTNYTLLTDGSLTALNSPTFLVLKARGTNMMFMSSNPTLDGVTAFNEWFGLTVTGQTAGTERIQYVFGGNNVTFATGAIALQRNKTVTASTYNFVAPSTITTAAGLEVQASLAGTNCTITRNYSGRFTGGLGMQITAGTIGGQGIVIGSLVGTTSQFGIYGGVTPSATNYFVTGAAGDYTMNSVTTTTFQVSAVSKLDIDTTGLIFRNAVNMSFNTSTGTKIGTATTQKIGFWNATPIVQPTTTVAAATFVVSVGTAVNDASTFDGYTLKQIVKALRNTGILA